MIFSYLNKIFTSKKFLHLCKKEKKERVSFDMSKNIKVNLIKIKYN